MAESVEHGGSRSPSSRLSWSRVLTFLSNSDHVVSLLVTNVLLCATFSQGLPGFLLIRRDLVGTRHASKSARKLTRDSGMLHKLTS